MNASSLGLAFFVGVATITGCAANGYAKRLHPDTSRIPPAAVMRRADAPMMILLDKPITQPVRYAQKSHVELQVDTIDNPLATDAPEVLLLAAIGYGEARGECKGGSDRCLAAVMHVALNRLSAGKWGDTLEDVVFAPKQFSALNQNDVNLRLIARMALTDGDADWQRCKDVARRVLAGDIKDPTGGSLFYHEESINPAWSRKMKRVARIGKHVFWRG